jgi:hypothetical protein
MQGQGLYALFSFTNGQAGQINTQNKEDFARISTEYAIRERFHATSILSTDTKM